jgi:hypothetical protein
MAPDYTERGRFLPAKVQLGEGMATLVMRSFKHVGCGKNTVAGVTAYDRLDKGLGT